MPWNPKNQYSKYKAKKTPCSHGHIHDSKHEAERCDELHLLLAAKEISVLRVQENFELIPAQYKIEKRYGKKGQPLKDKRVCLERACNYKADFTYFDKKGDYIVEDAKGKRTKEYLIKRKLMLERYGIRIKET